MTPRPRRRPTGRRAPTEAGIEDVTPATPAPVEARGRRADQAETSGRPTSDELDQRERRQSTKRKAPGPARARVTAKDVVVEKPKRTPRGGTTAEPPPTDPR
ncbi:MAG: hypothetical protein QOG01_2544 [Pseudonocardiales bacterium]|jgi:hypothetical protein|nr:hypothetical protein [Pseudonocardiales bacterium]